MAKEKDKKTEEIDDLQISGGQPVDFYDWYNPTDVGIKTKREQIKEEIAKTFESVKIADDPSTPENDIVLTVFDNKTETSRVIIPGGGGGGDVVGDETTIHVDKTKEPAVISVTDIYSMSNKVTIEKSATPPTPYLDSYVIKQGETELDTINVSRDFVITNGVVRVVSEGQEPYPGAKPGDRYLDLISNVAYGTPVDDRHLNIPLTELGYKSGSVEDDIVKIHIGEDNTISASLSFDTAVNVDSTDKAVPTSKAVYDALIAWETLDGKNHNYKII